MFIIPVRIFVTGVPTRITLSCVYIYLPSKFEFLVELCIWEMFCVLLRYTKWFWAGTRYRPLQTCCWWSNEATKTRLAVYSLGPMRDNWSALTRGNAVDSQSQGRTLSLKMPRSQHWEEECAAKYSVRVSRHRGVWTSSSREGKFCSGYSKVNCELLSSIDWRLHACQQAIGSVDSWILGLR